MVKRQVQVVESDISGEPDAATVTFGLDDEWYDIDLTEEETARLKEAFKRALKPFVAKGRKSESRPETKRVVADTTAEERDAIRTWAAANGHEVAPVGRIPRDVIAAYDAAHGIDRPYMPARSQASKKSEGPRLVPVTSPEERREIREWAAAEGYQFATSGQIPTDVIVAYDRHHAIEDRPYVPAGTKTPPKKSEGPRLVPVTSPEERREIREWAVAEGYQFAQSGRIPHEIVTAYDEKHGINRTYRPEGEPGAAKAESQKLTRQRVSPAVDAAERVKIRAWAIKKQLEVAPFGPISQHIVNAYDKAHRITRRS
ncbi:histone-like nucleoid-structuring protein Lsr2 [Amycolatopsis sp. TNS106]|uniref:Lsr2 dimerization domain-containing protein n=1 Tax=Amycolatopsis sp. TNS106 TaxID=2861750 RepID=UPI001C59A7AE|nr:histone-like nucleoid-structuring protein Lsr2 [Amycolatopsis sp. TNS106]QXV57417.1 hypothetical protein CVV72_10725 [Amycolatopsis sp. TNS106]